MIRRFRSKRLRNLAAGFMLPWLLLVPVAAGDGYFEISKNLEIFSDIYRELNLSYVDEIDHNRSMRHAIDGMLTNLDPYTVFYSEAEIENYRLSTTGKYGGIGATIRRRDSLMMIVDIHRNGPADLAGIRAGDYIIGVDGRDVRGRGVSDVSAVLKGQPGTIVKVKVQKALTGQVVDVVAEREDIALNDKPYLTFIQDGIGYVELRQFTDRCSNHIESAIKDLMDSGRLDGLIFDLRGNPGGLLPEAVNICNLFIPKDKLVVNTIGKVETHNFKTQREPLVPNLPVVVLTSRTSASASEIVSGVMQDYDRGIVVGERTFGKGLVQQTRNLSYKTSMKLTTAKYYVPSGRCIQAIDYSSRNPDGSVSSIPDSLKNTFYTDNGRLVEDGGGVAPDVEVSPEELEDISMALLRGDHIFDFATRYFSKHKEIGAARHFTLSDQDYADFVAFVSDRDYSYETETEALIAELKKTAIVDELMDETTQSLIASLEEQIDAMKSRDLERHRGQISRLLTQEIVTRYHYRIGRIECGIDEDPFVTKASELLGDPEAYRGILSPN